MTINNEIRPEVKLTGRDGNAYAVMGAARKAARKAGWSKTEVAEYLKEATSGDYDHLLMTTMKYFDVS